MQYFCDFLCKHLPSQDEWTTDYSGQHHTDQDGVEQWKDLKEHGFIFFLDHAFLDWLGVTKDVGSTVDIHTLTKSKKER
jgi:hypothetical protein